MKTSEKKSQSLKVTAEQSMETFSIFGAQGTSLSIAKGLENKSGSGLVTPTGSPIKNNSNYRESSMSKRNIEDQDELSDDSLGDFGLGEIIDDWGRIEQEQYGSPSERHSTQERAQDLGKYAPKARKKYRSRIHNSTNSDSGSEEVEPMLSTRSTHFNSSHRDRIRVRLRFDMMDDSDSSEGGNIENNTADSYSDMPVSRGQNS